MHPNVSIKELARVLETLSNGYRYDADYHGPIWNQVADVLSKAAVDIKSLES